MKDPKTSKALKKEKGLKNKEALGERMISKWWE
jgi:hypothetical protein